MSSTSKVDGSSADVVRGPEIVSQHVGLEKYWKVLKVKQYCRELERGGDKSFFLQMA